MENLYANQIIQLRNVLDAAQKAVDESYALHSSLEQIDRCEWYLRGIKRALEALEITESELRAAAKKCLF